MAIRLDSRPIAITGASSGIGAATARACARRGMPVALAARRVDRIEALASQIRSSGARAIAIPCDVTSDEDCQNLIERTIDAFGSIYSVFANAGYGFEASVLDTEDDRWNRIMDVNVLGTLRVVRPAARAMLKAGEGHIMLCSSALSKITLPEYSAYSASKACQDHIGRAMRHELRASGVQVSTVHPIGTRTEFFDNLKAGGTGEPATEDRSTTIAGDSRSLQRPEQVASAIVRRLASGKGGEVWTSLSTRTLLGVATMAPAIGDWGIRKRREKSRAKRQGASGSESK